MCVCVCVCGESVSTSQQAQLKGVTEAPTPPLTVPDSGGACCVLFCFFSFPSSVLLKEHPSEKNTARVAAAVTHELLEVIKRPGRTETPEGLVFHTWR